MGAGLGRGLEDLLDGAGTMILGGGSVVDLVDLEGAEKESGKGEYM